MKLTDRQNEILIELAFTVAMNRLFRDRLVWEAYTSGMGKSFINRCTGISRNTIDTIIARETRKNMKTLWDVLRRMLDSRPLSELEQALAHQIISAHEASTAATSPAADEAPAGDETPAPADAG